LLGTSVVEFSSNRALDPGRTNPPSKKEKQWNLLPRRRESTPLDPHTAACVPQSNPNPGAELQSDHD